MDVVHCLSAVRHGRRGRVAGDGVGVGVGDWGKVSGVLRQLEG